MRVDTLAFFSIDDVEAVLRGDKADTVVCFEADQSKGVQVRGVTGMAPIQANAHIQDLNMNADMLRPLFSGDYSVVPTGDGVIAAASISADCDEETGKLVLDDKISLPPGPAITTQSVNRHDMFTEMASISEVIRDSNEVAAEDKASTIKSYFDGATLKRLAGDFGVNVDNRLKSALLNFGNSVKSTYGEVPQGDKNTDRPKLSTEMSQKVAAYVQYMADGQKYPFTPGGMSF